MSTITLSGFSEAQQLLEKIPFELREKYLKKAVQEATNRISDDAARRVPPSVTTYLTPAQRKRKRLRDVIGERVKTYGAVVVGVGGPYSFARHGHLVEKGFHHTRGGTFADGKRTRKARRADRTGKGVRGGFVDGRPYLNPAFDAGAPSVEGYIVTALREFAAEVSRG